MVALPGGAYGIDNGTSVATAHVSGIVALMLARNPMLDPDTVRELLVRSVRRVADGGPPDDYGAGHADAYEAVVAVGPGESGPPVATGPVPVPMPARYEPTPQ
jgi:subtilisin family serine protease